MGIGLHHPRRVADLNRLQRGDGAVMGLGPADTVALTQPFHQLGTDLHHRVQRIFRILHDHRNALAAERAHFAFGGAHQVLPVEHHRIGLSDSNCA